MKDQSTTANPAAQDEDSANAPENQPLDSQEHPEGGAGNEEDTSTKNEDPEEQTPEDPSNGAPEDEGTKGEEEELDPLEKAKKHADQKIRELGDKAATGEKLVIAAVKKSPELLIEMFAEGTEMFNPDLAKKIAIEHPDVYKKADEEFKRRQIAQQGGPAPVQNQAPETDIKKIVAQVLEEERGKASEQTQLSEFQKELGMTDAQFQVLLPSLRPIAGALRQADSGLSQKESLERAFMAMFPGDYEKATKQKVLVDVARKRAMGTQGGGGDAGPTKTGELTPAQEEAWKHTSMTKERFMEIVKKYPEKF